MERKQTHILLAVMIGIALSSPYASGGLLCPVTMDIPDSYKEHFEYAVDVNVNRVIRRTPISHAGNSSESYPSHVMIWVVLSTGPYPNEFKEEFQDSRSNYHKFYMAFNGTDVCLSINQVTGQCIQQCFKATDYGNKDSIEIYTGSETLNGTTYQVVEILKIVNSKPYYQRRIICFVNNRVYTGDVEYVNSDIAQCSLGEFCRVTFWYTVQGGLPHYTIGCGVVDPVTNRCVDAGCAYNVSTGDSGTERYYQRCQHCCDFQNCNDLKKCSGMECDLYGEGKPGAGEMTTNTLITVDTSNAISIKYSLLTFALTVMCIIHIL